jgi:hypothetical protein
MSYAIKAVGSKNGRRFEGWAGLGKSPKLYDVVTSPEAARVLPLIDAQEFISSLRKWSKTLKKTTLRFYLIPLI